MPPKRKTSGAAKPPASAAPSKKVKLPAPPAKQAPVAAASTTTTTTTSTAKEKARSGATAAASRKRGRPPSAPPAAATAPAPTAPPVKVTRISTQPRAAATAHATTTTAHEVQAIGTAPEALTELVGPHTLLRRFRPPPTTTPLQRGGGLMSSSAVTAAAAVAGDVMQWNTNDAVVFSTYLASVETHFTRHCCQQLAQLTSATSPGFLHAAALGEAALASQAASPLSGSSSAEVPPLLLLLDRQEQAYRTVRATIAASCTLGHRSCQVLWGPRGSGKHRLLRLLAQEVRRTAGTFVMELHGRLLKDDAAALGVIAEQLLAFLLSPQSSALRAGHYLLRTGTFGFGQLFHYEQRIAEDHATSSAGVAVAGGGGARPQAAHAHVASESSADSDETSDDQDDEDKAETSGGTGVLVTSTTTYLTGGAASALPHLQRALLLLKSQGCNMVVCIRDIDVFGVRCDQLLYVLSGLMHDSETATATTSENAAAATEGGACGNAGSGGLSLLLASAAPDIRQLEKRLSSRLTCETRYVPLLPWSLRNLLAATLHTTFEDSFFQVRLRELGRQRAELVAALREGATQLRKAAESTAGRVKDRERAQAELKATMAGLEARLHASDAALRELRAQRRQLQGMLESAEGAGGGSSPASANGVLGTARAAGAGVFPALGHFTPSGWRSTDAATASTPGGMAAHKTASASASRLPSASFTTARTWTVAALLDHATLTLEVQCVMAEELLRQLQAAGIPPRTEALAAALSTGVTLAPSSPAALTHTVTELSVELEVNSSPASTVLTALTSSLCKAAGGAVDLLGDSGRRVLLTWLRARLQHESIPPPRSEASDAHGAAAAGVPVRILTGWRATAQALAQPTRSAAAAATATSSGSSSTSLQPPFAVSDADPHEGVRVRPSVPALSLLPPHLHDLLAEGQLVGMGYGSRELLLVLFYMHVHLSSGVRQRTVADLLEDVASSLGTKAAAALDREAFRHAVRLLCRWRLLRVVEAHSQLLEVCGSDARLREFLLTVLSKQPTWCAAELGLDARETVRLRNLL